MSTNAIPLSAISRDRTGTGGARAVRREGLVPGIVYGGGGEPVTIAVSEKELVREHGKKTFMATLFALAVDGKTVRVLPRDVQLHPVTDRPEHVDFQRVSAKDKIHVMVPVEFVNHEKSPGLKRGGILNVVRHEVELICPADHIPGSLTVDLSGRNIGDSVHIEDIALPGDAKPVIARNFTLATIAGRGGKDEDAEGAEGETPAA